MVGIRKTYGPKKNITNDIIVVDQKHAGLFLTYRRTKWQTELT
jgi:hypothetical protein